MGYKTTFLLLSILQYNYDLRFKPLNLNYITVRETEVHTVFPSALKKTKPGKHQQRVTLYEFPKEPKFCSVSLLQCYISKTQTSRKSHTKRLLSFTKLHEVVSTRTKSRLLNTSLKNVGIDVNIYQGHSLHMAYGSKASLHCLNIQSILKAGKWSRELTFAKYYKKDLLIDQFLQSSLF